MIDLSGLKLQSKSPALRHLLFLVSVHCDHTETRKQIMRRGSKAEDMMRCIIHASSCETFLSVPGFLKFSVRGFVFWFGFWLFVFFFSRLNGNFSFV